MKQKLEYNYVSHQLARIREHHTHHGPHPGRWHLTSHRTEVGRRALPRHGPISGRRRARGHLTKHGTEIGRRTGRHLTGHDTHGHLGTTVLDGGGLDARPGLHHLG